MSRDPAPGKLEDRAEAYLAASDSPPTVEEVARALFRTSGNAGGAAVLAALLRRDPRFRLVGGRVSLDPGDLTAGGLSAETPLERVPLAVVDFETTGYGTRDRAIEVGVACFQGGEEVDLFETLLDPGVPPSPFVVRLTGIRPSDLAGKPAFRTAWPSLEEQFRGRVVAAHNLPFDMGVLGRELRAAKGGDRFDHVGRLCTLKLARRLVPRGESRSLGALAERFALPTGSRHRALDDARLAGRLFYRLLQVAGEERAMRTWGDLQGLLKGTEKGRA